jgi:poly-gamma-glutamate capsule biosynthesis protein CapA/YwtB (metallophosphatase superfamily)
MLWERIALRSAPWARAPHEVRVSVGASTAKLLALGDLALTDLAAFGVRSVFGPIAEHLESADLITANLEAALTGRSEPSGCIGSAIRANPHAVRTLVGAQIDVVTLANNHALDFGAAALAETIELLRDSGVGACGARQDGTAAPLVVREANGLRVGFLGACDDHFVPLPSADGPNCGVESDEQLPELISRARPQVDFLVVHLHWGYEFTLHPLLEHRDRARQLADLGADLVLCHHAHVPQGIEQWHGAVIAYGLGNAVTPLSAYMRAGHPWTDRSFALEVDFGRAGISAIRLIPFGLGPDGSMTTLRERHARDLLAGIAQMSRRLVDQPFLARIERARTAFEFVRLAETIRDAASAPGSQLAERARTLKLARQRRLLNRARSFEGLAAAVDGLQRLAGASEDAREVLQAYAATRASLDTILARPCREYLWQDALRSRVP